MKKVLLTSMILLSTVSYGGNVYAQETSGDAPAATTPTTAKASVTFTPSVDGKTLTISGQGDLTSYMTTDFSARVFTDKAVGFVFADAAGNIPVVAGGSYNAGKTYYQAEYNYTKVWETEPIGWSTAYFGQVTPKKEWKEDKIVNLYKGYLYYDGKSIVPETKVDSKTEISTASLNNGDYADKSIYFICSDETLKGQPVLIDDMESKGVQFVSLNELNDYVNSDVTYQVKDAKLFLSKDGGQTYTGLTPGVDYKWTSGDVFYQGEATYAQIESNDAFFGEKGTHPDFLKADDTEISFKDLLMRKILAGIKVTDGKNEFNDVTPIYETVKFVNTGSEPLYINNDIVSAILYPIYNNWDATNVTTKVLDLGDATVNDLTSSTFIPTEASYRSGYLKLTNLTLPLTNKTSVLNEDSKVNQYEDKMVVPSNILEHFVNLSSLVDVTIPEGYERIGNEAFANLKVVDFHFPSTLKLIGDKAFYNCNYITNIEFNEGLLSIGEEAFHFGEASEMRSVKFPSTLKIIKDGAFANDKIYDLKFNAGLEFIGNGAFALPAQQVEQVLEIPASVKYIGPAAFDFRQYQDVYFYGEKAPLMPLGNSKYSAQSTNVTAFYSKSLMGYGGFQKGDTRTEADIMDNAGEGYANRENYKNGGTYFCILHFPKDLNDDNRATYSDITRIYKTVEEGKTFYYAKTDGNPDTYYVAGKEEKPLKWYNSETAAGKNLDYGFQDTYLGRQYIWPSQEAWLRSYIVNSNGYNWNGVDKYRPELTADDIATLAYAGYVIGDGEGQYTEDELRKIAHLGTRQFVLANADVTKDDKPEEEPTYPINIKGGEWWTLCVPFNMTKSQVTEVFGAETRVCIFNKVERLVDRANQARYIRLYFTKDAYLHKTTVVNDKIQMDDNSSTGDDDIVIYAHQSYMIYPKKSSEDANKMYNIADYQLVTGSPLPTLVKANETVDGNMGTMAPDDEDDWNKEYRFVGNYQTQVAETQSTENQSAGVATQAFKTVTIPQYSYIYAVKKGDSKAQFWFYKGTTAAWGANKCVVQATARDGGLTDYENYFGGNSSVTAKQAIQQSFFGDNGETTGVNNFVIIAGEAKDAQVVYNLNGQIVNNNGNLDVLQKGVYIKNGKKYMVK